ncbi:hypothetical protein Acr_00g0000870 [Actinidia rufa]|uniref:Uncharacterized protein n=1 Tax=Actinidia rufa TaxID=165716 RepID=A0A7J0D732_9ERIC|nr:hypothetical protein Acr_00g0000870 [Actinidia rufa]
MKETSHPVASTRSDLRMVTTWPGGNGRDLPELSYRTETRRLSFDVRAMHFRGCQCQASIGPQHKARGKDPPYCAPY